MGKGDDNHPDNKKLKGEEFKGPSENRKCTDVLCILIIIAHWIALTGIGLTVLGVIESDSLQKGDPNRLINAIDYDGRICGVDDEVKDKSKGYYLQSGAAVCVEECPSDNNYYRFICDDNAPSGCVTDSDITDVGLLTDCTNAIIAGECMVHLSTTDIFNYCILDQAIDFATNQANMDAAYAAAGLNSTATAEYNEGSDDGEYLEQFLGDVYTARGIIFGVGIGVSVVMGFIYLFFLRMPGVLSIMVWSIVFSILVIFLAGGGLVYTEYQKWDEEDPKTHSQAEIDALQYVSYACFICAALYACLVLVMRKRIILSIGVVKEAARSLAYMPALIAFPVVQALGVVLFFVPWMIYAVFLASSGEITVTEYCDVTGTTCMNYKEFTYSDEIRYAALYLLFSWFWTTQFIIAMGQLVVAMAVSLFYFSKNKSSEIGNKTVSKSLKQSFYYHMGTAAFGSLIIAIIKTIRAVILYLQRQAKKSKNKLAQFVLAVIQCCMWCVEKCMKFINKNAYIQTAIFSYSFCTAARKAFFLILRNLLRIAAVSLVGDFVLLLGKLLIPATTTFIAYLAITQSGTDEKLNGIVGPLVFVFLISYFVALMFNEIFGMAISTIFQCFVADEEMFENPNDRHAEKDLASLIGKTAKAAANAKVVPEDSAADGAAIQVKPKEKEDLP